MISHVTWSVMIREFAHYGRWLHKFQFVLKKIALNLVHFLVIVLKKNCYFYSNSGKMQQAKQCNLLLCEPRNRSLCKFNIFIIFRSCACLAKIHLRLWLFFPCIWNNEIKKRKEIMLFIVVLETEQSHIIFGLWQIIVCPKQITLWLTLRRNPQKTHSTKHFTDNINKK